MKLPALRRGWWKPWNWSTRTWVGVIIVSALISPFVTRFILLWQVPDVILPFDVEDVIQEDVPKDEDAIYHYEKTLALVQLGTTRLEENDRKFSNYNEADTAMRAAVLDDSAKWDDRLDEWLISRDKALAELRIATDMPRASGPSLRTADVYQVVNTHQQLRSLVVLAQAEAMRLERAGQYEHAWEWHRASLRCARHCLMPRYVICHLIGMGARSTAYSGIARWAQSPALTETQLQTARDELAIDRATMVPLFDIAKSNYLCLRNSMANDHAPNLLYPRWSLATPEEPYVVAIKNAILWTVGQPEIVLRLARQELVNIQDQIDAPLHSRQKALHLKCEVVFELDPNTRRRSGQLHHTRLKSLLDENLRKLRGLDEYLLGAETVDKGQRLHLARNAVLDVTLASHQYQRAHGEFPQTLSQLVPTFLREIPLDPMDAGGGLIQYRAEENGQAVVWSFGYNATDDGGDIQKVAKLDGGYRDLGYRIQINRAADAKGHVEKAAEDRNE